MNVYQLTVTYTDNIEAEVTVGADTPEQAMSNLEEFLKNSGFVNIEFTSVTHLGDAANFHNTEGTLN